MSKKRSREDHNVYASHNKAGDPIPSSPIDRPSKFDIPREKRLHVVAWNLNGMRAFMAKRSAELATMWKAEDVDILGITETKITDQEKADEIEALVSKCLKGEEVKFVWNMCKTKKGYSGSLAIIRKRIFDQIKSISFGIGSDDIEGRVINLHLPNTSVVIVYVPNSGQNLERLDYRISTWDKQFSKHCCELSKDGKSVIIAGDLNVAHRDMDIWNVDAPHVPKGAGTTPQERYSFETQLLDKGFKDTFVEKHADKTGWFTYHSIRARNKPKNRGLRLDYVLAANTSILDAFITCDYAKDGDHCPVGVKIALE